MPRFLLQATFNQEAAKRLIEDGGTKRAVAVQELLRQHEARLENLYFSPQNDGPDAFAIVEVSVGGADALGAMALAGRTTGITLTARRIFTPEEMDKVAEKSKGIPVPGNRSAALLLGVVAQGGQNAALSRRTSRVSDGRRLKSPVGTRVGLLMFLAQN